MELLSPAGNMTSLKSAVACGADAVYLGAGDFNARSKADNFGTDELRLAVSYCHERGVRVYLTLNTLVKSRETARALETAREAADCGVDAFIVQDLALAALLRKELPYMPLHASTQMGIHNVYGAIFAKKAGFDRIIFSREALPEDMAKCKRETGLETEAFVHGAHCVSFSGNCYFSALVSGYSGNRGKCLQLCRKKYTLAGEGRTARGYILSAKDICLLGNLRTLEEAGVDSLKIEGRLRSPEYVGTVTSAYAAALRGKDPDRTAVRTVFNRGEYSEAYISTDRPDIIYPKTQNNIGSFAATVAAVRSGTVFVKGAFRARNGDGFKVLRRGRETGSAVCRNGKICAEGDVRPGDELRLTRSAEISESIRHAVQIDKPHKITEYHKIPVKNHSSMSDIVCKYYEFPEKCMIVRMDESCSPTVADRADAVIFAPLEYSARSIEVFLGRLKRKPSILLELPVEARGKDLDILKEIGQAANFDGYVANNIYALEMFSGERLVMGSEMNLLSDFAAGARIASQEAAAAERGDIVQIYGREILMNLTHCPRRQLGLTCEKCEGTKNFTLTDESGAIMPLRRRKLSYCYFELLNSKIRNICRKLPRHLTRLLVDARGLPEKSVIAVTSDPYNFPFDAKTDTSGRWGKGVK